MNTISRMNAGLVFFISFLQHFVYIIGTNTYNLLLNAIYIFRIISIITNKKKFYPKKEYDNIKVSPIFNLGI